MPRRSVVLVLAFMLAAVCAIGQTMFGRISGAVTDPSGSPIPAAKVTVRNMETQATRALTTDQSGNYTAENLSIGPYRVEVDAPGFKHSTRTGLQLSADARLTADFKLEIGEATQTVDVVSTPTEQVNTVSGEVS